MAKRNGNAASPNACEPAPAGWAATSSRVPLYCASRICQVIPVDLAVDAALGLERSTGRYGRSCGTPQSARRDSSTARVPGCQDWSALPRETPGAGKQRLREPGRT